MKRAEQNRINKEVLEFLATTSPYPPIYRKHEVVKLRSCQAKVYITDEHFILKSYNTCVAAIDRKTGIAYDFLRKVYGYTPTSAQHISKFLHDYEHKYCLVYRPV